MSYHRATSVRVGHEEQGHGRDQTNWRKQPGSKGQARGPSALGKPRRLLRDAAMTKFQAMLKQRRAARANSLVV